MNSDYLSDSQVRKAESRALRDFQEVRLQPHALAYNLVNFMRTLILLKEVEH